MGRIFDQNNPFFRIMGLVCDLIVLNLLTLVCSIPIVTAGASFTAMHYVLWHMVRHEDTYVARQFLDAFKANFKQATVVWLGALVLIAFGVLDSFVLSEMLDQGVARAMTIVLVVVGVLVAAVAQYYFVMLSRYENTVGGHLANAARLAFAFFPRTLAMLIVIGAFGFVELRYLLVGLPALLLLGVALPQYCCAWLYDPIFRRLDGDYDENGKLVKSTFL